MSNSNIGVIVGRFQPITLEQINTLFIPAFQDNDSVIIILGSSDTARDELNPFTALEREKMIATVLGGFNHKTSFTFRYIRDYWYNKTRFLASIQDSVSSGIKELYNDSIKLSDVNISLYGLDKEDDESDYLKNFPSWNSKVLTGTAAKPVDVMTKVYEGGNWATHVPGSVKDFIWNWLETDAGKRILAGHQHIARYRRKYDPLEASAGHALQFMTVDNVVLHKGHILLVRRRSHPGKGLWALPGGFLESNETTIVGAKRELQEETRLRVKDEWQTGFKHFDHPYRSRRGRTLTFAYKWEIPAWRDVPQLSPEKGFEHEVTKVQWFPLSEVINDMSDLLFEDHLDIIESLAY